MRNCKQRKMFKYIGQGEMVQRPQKLKIRSCLEGLKYIVGCVNYIGRVGVMSFLVE